MPTKIFLTGVTGYIGGDAFYLLSQSQSSLEFALLVRSQEAASAILEKYPSVRIVHGELDDSALLEREAAWADIVIRKIQPTSCQYY
jgi:N-acetyl-gamma-glutamylphosphate reductase